MATSTSQERKTAKASSSGAATEAKAGATAAATDTSRLIEFPGVPPKPQWRKELSERVREIQQRRALEAERETEAPALSPPQGHQAAGAVGEANIGATGEETVAPPLGLVPPPPETPQPNPLVVAALKRIERARQPNPAQMSRPSRGGAAAAVAVAHYVEEDYQAATEPALNADQLISPALDAQGEPAAAAAVDQIEEPLEATRPSPLAIVPSATVTKTAEESHATETRAHRHIPVVADDAALSEIEARMHAAVLSNHSETEFVTTNDHAPVSKRIAGGVIDLLVVAFAATPFAAIIELTNGNWSDVRVAASMGGVVVVLTFLYITAATALAGRTWGMSLVALRTVDAETGTAPTTGQCARRAIGYMLSLATLGIGLLYAFFDAEGRAVHDHLSGTIVITE